MKVETDNFGYFAKVFNQWTFIKKGPNFVILLRASLNSGKDVLKEYFSNATKRNQEEREKKRQKENQNKLFLLRGKKKRKKKEIKEIKNIRLK